VEGTLVVVVAVGLGELVPDRVVVEGLFLVGDDFTVIVKHGNDLVDRDRDGIRIVIRQEVDVAPAFAWHPELTRTDKEDVVGGAELVPAEELECDFGVEPEVIAEAEADVPFGTRPPTTRPAISIFVEVLTVFLPRVIAVGELADLAGDVVAIVDHLRRLVSATKVTAGILGACTTVMDTACLGRVRVVAPG
jgi:hypothetical protein